MTVFFRFLLVLPHLVWLGLWFSLALPVAIANWISALFSGQSSPTLHRFLAAYARYAAHVLAYATLVADPFPGFTGRQGSYPVDLEVDPPGAQNRWVTGFRLVLALPAMLLADTMVGFGTSLAGGASSYGGGVAVTAAFLGWFASMARGRMPRGLRDVAAWGIGYSSQVNGYLLILTDRYPRPDPAVGPWVAADRRDPIRMTLDDDLRRSRLTVFLRFPLVFPHLIWLLGWSVVMVPLAIVGWFVTLIRGRLPDWLHRFTGAYVRYTTHVYAFLQVVGNPFPGFTGRPGVYPVDVQIDPRERQNRWITAFRVFLALPAMVLGSAISTVGFVAALLGWFVALFTGRLPLGLRNTGAFALRYNAQLLGYLLFLTDRYPYSAPAVGGPARTPVPQEA